MKKEYPYLAAVHEVEGGAYILKKDYQAALDSYKRALEYNPQNISLNRTIHELEVFLGVPYDRRVGNRKPAQMEPKNEK